MANAMAGMAMSFLSSFIVLSGLPRRCRLHRSPKLHRRASRSAVRLASCCVYICGGFAECCVVAIECGTASLKIGCSAGVIARV